MTSILTAANTALLAVALPLSAQTWNEQNAGERNTTVEATLGNGALTKIVGTINTNESADLYLINVDDPFGFTISSAGSPFDTQMWMFDLNGNGISFKDDAGGGVYTSTLTGQFVSAGRIIVGISRFDMDPLDSNGDQLWNDSPFNVERQPDGPGAANPFAQWSATNNTISPYELTLTGASFAAPATADRPDVAWACVAYYGGPTTWTVPIPWQHTETGELITVERLSLGRYRVRLPVSMNVLGVLHASGAYGSSAVIENWNYIGNKLACNINVFDDNGALLDQVFYMNYRHGGAIDERGMYLWAGNPTTTGPYTPATGNNFNANRPYSTITRLGVGDYEVIVPDLYNVGGAEFGNVQVTPYSGSGSTALTRASVVSWGSINTVDLRIRVKTHDTAGTPTDSKFVLSYTETGGLSPEHLGSGAHVWADNATAASYTPSARWTDSNIAAAGAITVDRLNTGSYQVNIPGVTSVAGMTAQATGYGGNNWAQFDYASANSAGTKLYVSVRDFAGTLVDGRFSLFYNNNTPAGAAGKNAIIGTGCAGLLLNPLNRPVVGDTWDMMLEDLPPSSVLGVISLGFNNFNIPIDFLGAPGCWAYTDQVTLKTVNLPSATPSYALPNLANLLGLDVYAQGGAFASGINSLNLVTSNALRGTIGDV